MCFDVSGRNIRVIFLRKFTLFFRRVIIYLLVWMIYMPYIKGEKEKTNYLTEVAGEGGPDLAPQKFLSSQKFFW